MAKFRSWNEKAKCFHYWEDGRYYIFNNTYQFNMSAKFNWKKAEQGVIIDGQEIFENDFIKYQIDNIKDKVWSEPAIVINTGYSFETRIEPYDKETPFNQCLMYPKRFRGCDFKVVGNIHEGEK